MLIVTVCSINIDFKASIHDAQRIHSYGFDNPPDVFFLENVLNDS